MRREQMDSASRYIYLFGSSGLYSRGSNQVLGALLADLSLRQAASIFCRLFFLRKRIHARVLN